MRTINENIKNNEYKKVYLLYGEEAYLRKQYRDKLKDAIIGDDTMNYGYFEGKGADVSKIIEMSETLPFFSDRRLIIVENSGFFKNANDTLVDYMDKIPDTTIFVFVETDVDKRGRMFKKVKTTGYESEMNIQTPAVLEKWVLGIISGNGKKISGEALGYFLSVVGSDMNTISKELEKLICYCMDSEVIELSHVKAVTTEQISARIFDMVDALGYKNQKKTLDIYYDLIATKEPPSRILYMLVRQFNILLQVKELMQNGMGQKEIAAKMAMQPFIIGKAVKQAGNFSAGDLRCALEDAVDTEYRIKSQRLEEKVGVEMLLIKYSNK